MDLRRAVVEGVRIQMLSGTHILLLRDAEERRYLPIPIGPNEANAIAYHLQGVRPERPLTHDIATLMMSALGAELREVRIVELRDETFRARMLVAPPAGRHRNSTLGRVMPSRSPCAQTHRSTSRSTFWRPRGSCQKRQKRSASRSSVTL